MSTQLKITSPVNSPFRFDTEIETWNLSDQENREQGLGSIIVKQ